MLRSACTVEIYSSQIVVSGSKLKFVRCHGCFLCLFSAVFMKIITVSSTLCQYGNCGMTTLKRYTRIVFVKIWKSRSKMTEAKPYVSFWLLQCASRPKTFHSGSNFLPPIRCFPPKIYVLLFIALFVIRIVQYRRYALPRLNNIFPDPLTSLPGLTPARPGPAVPGSPRPPHVVSDMTIDPSAITVTLMTPEVDPHHQQQATTTLITSEAVQQDDIKPKTPGSSRRGKQYKCGNCHELGHNQ